MKNYLLLICLILLSIPIFCGCFNAKPAESVATQLYETIKTKDFEKALTYYDDQFFEKTSRNDWLDTLKRINIKLGDLLSYELGNVEVVKTGHVGLGNSDTRIGTYYTMHYEVTYSKYTASETLTLFKPAATDIIKITGHNFSSQGFIKE